MHTVNESINEYKLYNNIFNNYSGMRNNYLTHLFSMAFDTQKEVDFIYLN